MGVLRYLYDTILIVVTLCQVFLYFKIAIYHVQVNEGCHRDFLNYISTIHLRAQYRTVGRPVSINVSLIIQPYQIPFITFSLPNAPPFSHFPCRAY